MQRFSWADRILVVLGLGFLAVTLGPALVGRELLLDVNLLSGYAPWRSIEGPVTSAVNLCRGDTVDSIMPITAQIRSTLTQGHYPSWTSLAAGGVPLGGPSWAQFSPLSLPDYLVPLRLAPAVVTLLEFLVGIVGMTAFLRRLRLPSSAGLLAGLAYCSSGFMISWTNWPQTRVAAFIPALFWAAERLLQSPRLRSAVPLSLIVACLLLGGFPAITGMSLYAVGAYFLVRLLLLHRQGAVVVGRALASAAAGLALGFGLTCFQLIPFALGLGGSDLGYRESYTGQTAPLGSLLTTVAPQAQGLCVGGLRHGVLNPIESTTFVGAAVVVLAVVALVGRRGRSGEAAGATAFFVVASVVAVVLGWVGGWPLAVVQHLPVFSANPIYRVNALLAFFLCVLAGIGFHRLLAVATRGRTSRGRPGSAGSAGSPGWLGSGLPEGPPSRRRLLGPTVMVLLVLVVAALIGRGAWVDAVDGGYLGHLEDSLVVPLVLVVVVVLLVGVVVLLRTRGRAAPARVAVLLVALVAVGQGAAFVQTDTGGSGRELFYPLTPVHAFLRDHLGSDRFDSTDLLAYPATGTYYGLRAPTGHAFFTPTWAELLRAQDPDVFKSPTYAFFGSNRTPLARVGRAPLLDRLAVRYWLASDSQVPGPVARAASDSTLTLSPGHPLTCRVSGPLRGVVVTLAGPMVGHEVTLRAQAQGGGGAVSGERRLAAGAPAVTPVVIGMPGEDLAPGAPVTVEVSVTGTTGPTTVQAMGGGLACGVVSPEDDGLRLMHSSDGITVFERLTSLPRIRWASSSVVLPDPATRLATLRAGLPATTVALQAPGPVTGSRPASVAVQQDDGPSVAARVEAQGAGYLVVADALQQRGWSATVDGRRADLVPADHAFVAVFVPAGSHVVRLSYEIPGFRVGATISLLSALVLLVVGVLGSRRRPRSARRRVAPPRPRGDSGLNDLD